MTSGYIMATSGSSNFAWICSRWLMVLIGPQVRWLVICVPLTMTMHCLVNYLLNKKFLSHWHSKQLKINLNWTILKACHLWTWTWTRAVLERRSPTKTYRFVCWSLWSTAASLQMNIIWLFLRFFRLYQGWNKRYDFRGFEKWIWYSIVTVNKKPSG